MQLSDTALALLGVLLAAWVAGAAWMMIAASGKARRVRLEGGPPLSILPYDYPTEELQLQNSEVMLFITDGVTEAQDEEGRLFGTSFTGLWFEVGTPQAIAPT